MITRHGFLLHDFSSLFTKKLCLGFRAGVITTVFEIVFEPLRGVQDGPGCFSFLCALLSGDIAFNKNGDRLAPYIIKNMHISRITPFCPTRQNSEDFLYVSQNRFICRGSHGLAKGALVGPMLR